ncbi:hypothetical protein GCM10008938_42050 [Deinococcus roseus]|uniref:Uncharacterized protein n=1 Tax=Deinococcus roseus TaxID=392414 RepID=A0ABQ2DAK7_9DEIO|nr:hypothetical protein GCM10008938_42050 [Deinococcus roseus]
MRVLAKSQHFIVTADHETTLQHPSFMGGKGNAERQLHMLILSCPEGWIKLVNLLSI